MADIETTIQGVARNVQWREKDIYTVLSFNVEQTHEGNVVGNMPVELRDTMIKGTLVDGDEVEMTGKIDTEGILIPRRLLNLRTKACITKYGSDKVSLIFLFPFAGGVIGIAIGLGVRGLPGAGTGFGIGFTAGGFLLICTIIFLVVTYAFKKKTG